MPQSDSRNSFKSSPLRWMAALLALLIAPSLGAAETAPLVSTPAAKPDTATDVVCDGSAPAVAAERRRFFAVADWGVVEGHRERMVEYCAQAGAQAGANADSPASPSLRCTPDLRICQARGIRIDVPLPEKPSQDNKTAGVTVSTTCAVNAGYPRSARFFGGISDWGPELKGLRGAQDGRPCDVVIHEPTLLIKPDSGANIYHGLCDHVNLFLSARIAGWQDAPDLQIVTWDPASTSERVRSGWYELYDAFTTRPVRPLGFWAGKSVCFDNAVFAVNPRAVGTFYFNMDVPGGAASCHSGPGGFVRAFAERTKARVLAHPPRRPGPDDPVRIKIMSRTAGTGTTSGTRKVTNEAELVAAVRRRVPGVEVEVVNFDWNGRPPITGQLALMADTDVLVGMHGAGLVHTLWLPEWAVMYEIYNCGDVDTYHDLARLAGIGYLKARESDVVHRFPPDVSVAEENRKNPKFWNYEIGEDAFVANVQEAVRRVRANPASPFRKPAAEPRPTAGLDAAGASGD
jgi:protein O-GlcNAc transferase